MPAFAVPVALAAVLATGMTLAVGVSLSVPSAIGLVLGRNRAGGLDMRLSVPPLGLLGALGTPHGQIDLGHVRSGLVLPPVFASHPHLDALADLEDARTTRSLLERHVDFPEDTGELGANSDEIHDIRLAAFAVFFRMFTTSPCTS